MHDIVLIDCLAMNLNRDVKAMQEKGYKVHGLTLLYRTVNVHSPQTIAVQAMIKEL